MKSDKGIKSIQAYALYDGDLRGARHLSQIQAFQDYLSVYVGRLATTKDMQNAKQFAITTFQQKLNKSPPYSAAIEDYIPIALAEFAGQNG